MQHLTRPAFGQSVLVGALYDDKRDSFLPRSILTSGAAQGFVKQETISSQDVQLHYDATYYEKLKMLAVGPDLGASIICDLIQVQGTGRYLQGAQGSERALQGAVYLKTTTSREKLDLQSPTFAKCLVSDVLKTSEVSHVVIEVEYGVTAVVTAKHWLQLDERRPDIQSQFQTQLQKFRDSLHDLCLKDQNTCSTETVADIPLDIMVYSAEGEGIEMQDFQEAREFLKIISTSSINETEDKGEAISYKLLPLSVLPLFLSVHVEQDLKASPPSHECLAQFFQLFDEFGQCRQSLKLHHSYISKYQHCLPQEHVQQVASDIRSVETAENTLKKQLARTIQDVRWGTSEPGELQRLLAAFTSGSQSPRYYSNQVGQHQDKIRLIDEMLTRGVKYIGYNGLNLRSELTKRGRNRAFVLSFSDQALQDSESLDDNKSLFLELIKDHQNDSFFAVLDCDTTKTPLKHVVITEYHNGSAQTENLLESHKFLTSNNFALCSPQNLDTQNKEKPLKRRFVKLACPRSSCSKDETRNWLCPKCQAPLEYGFSDDYIYCDCGRSLYTNYLFRCNNASHGSDFSPFQPSVLLTRLKSLDDSDYLNILILGETGVGKSTFINAFVNYLYFKSLDEAISADELRWLIPCSFSVNVMDRSSANARILQRKVVLGSRSDEHDGTTGRSATQETKVYPITVGTTTYRLIDTPGIGDTRGLLQDKKNLSDILQTLSGYENIHGILILLKSNDSRLTPHLEFCVKELLSRLHRSATKNVVFGLTNSRNTNYEPGETLKTLEALLTNGKIDINLSATTIYCFDSESFRFLAAVKANIPMENKKDFVSSWDKSSSEAWRMIRYFKSSEPHPTQSTMSLNGTRQLISELTTPMAEITSLIRSNIANYEEEVKHLRDARLTGDRLRLALRPQRKCLRTKTLKQPRTVCTDKSCVEFKDDGSGTSKMLTDYVTHCHPACWLTGVTPDVQADPSLRNCAAFSAGKCKTSSCSHDWTQHMHVLYELESYLTDVMDLTIEEQLKTNASDITLKQSAIKSRQNLMKEFKQEHEEVQQAAAKFVLWMKANSLIHYNDATLAYLDMLIENEKMKVDAGGKGNQEILKSLEKERARHLELIELYKIEMKSSGKVEPIDQQGIIALVHHLYNMKHFGKNIQSLKQSLSTIYAATNRELPHRVSKGRQASWMSFPSFLPTTNSRQPDQHLPARPMKQPSAGPVTQSKRRSGLLHKFGNVSNVLHR